VLVVARHISRQHRLQLSSTDDEHPVQPAHDGLCRPVARRPRSHAARALASAQTRTPFRRNRLEAVSARRVPVAGREPELPDVVCQVQQRLRLVRQPTAQSVTQLGWDRWPTGRAAGMVHWRLLSWRCRHACQAAGQRHRRAARPTGCRHQRLLSQRQTVPFTRRHCVHSGRVGSANGRQARSAAGRAAPEGPPSRGPPRTPGADRSLPARALASRPWLHRPVECESPDQWWR
jgi:hypothetical protein